MVHFEINIVPRSRRASLIATVLAIWKQIEDSCPLSFPTVLCRPYFHELSTSTNVGNNCLVWHTITLEATVLTFRCFLPLICHCVRSSFGKELIDKNCKGKKKSILLLQDRIWKKPFNVSIFTLLKCVDVDIFLVTFFSARSCEIFSDAKGCPKWYPYNFEYNLAMKVPKYTGINRAGPFVCQGVRVLFGAD